MMTEWKPTKIQRHEQNPFFDVDDDDVYIETKLVWTPFSSLFSPSSWMQKKSIFCTILVETFIASKWDGHHLLNRILQSTWETWGLPFEILTRNLEISRAKYFFNFSIMLLKRIMKSFVMNFNADTFFKRFCKYVWNDSFRQINFSMMKVAIFIHYSMRFEDEIIRCEFEIVPIFEIAQPFRIGKLRVERHEKGL